MEYLCCLIGFDNSKTATLVKGKPLEYEGEIYSEEHKRGLMTEGAGLQIVKDRLTGQSQSFQSAESRRDKGAIRQAAADNIPTYGNATERQKNEIVRVPP